MAAPTPIPGKRTPPKLVTVAIMAVVVVGLILLVFVGRVLLQTADTPGSQARDFVSSKYPKLLVEIDYMVEGGTSYRPSSAVLSFLQQRLDERLDKPGGITIEVGDAIPATRTSYSPDDLRGLEGTYRHAHTGGDTAALWILFATRSSEPGSGGGQIIGVAYSGSACAVYASTIKDASGILVSADTVGEITSLHEVGHLLGLVNGGTPMVTPHEDTAHPRHSTNTHSVMYWQVEGTDIISAIQSGGVPDNFDANDIADLRDIGGK